MKIASLRSQRRLLLPSSRGHAVAAAISFGLTAILGGDKQRRLLAPCLTLDRIRDL
jgi:hypothetical protein